MISAAWPLMRFIQNFIAFLLVLPGCSVTFVALTLGLKWYCIKSFHQLENRGPACCRMLECDWGRCTIWVFSASRMLWPWVRTVPSCWVLRCRSSPSFSCGSRIQRWNNLNSNLVFAVIPQSACFCSSFDLKENYYILGRGYKIAYNNLSEQNADYWVKLFWW